MIHFSHLELCLKSQYVRSMFWIAAYLDRIINLLVTFNVQQFKFLEENLQKLLQEIIVI